MPFAGCPGRCIYCSQRTQTGESKAALKQVFYNFRTNLEKKYQDGHSQMGAAFFGGTFTAIPRDWQRSFLHLANDFKAKGVIKHIRCSTRPDYVRLDELQALRQYGLDMVELGIQTFEDKVLKTSGRGYSSDRAFDACRTVRQAGLELGIQMLPGLPGHTISKYCQDIEHVCRILPRDIRIYPCLVLKDTLLSSWWEQGVYTPWSLQSTIEAISLTLPRLWERGINIIRIGLAAEASMLEALQAGPWHRALGNICRGKAMRDIIISRLGMLPSAPSKILIPQRYVSDFWGYRKQNRHFFEKKGLYPSRVSTHNKKYFLFLA